MKKCIFLLLMGSSYLALDADVIYSPRYPRENPRTEIYNYYEAPYYSEYQPDNGPMRGPNSLDAYKYGGRRQGYRSPYQY